MTLPIENPKLMAFVRTRDARIEKRDCWRKEPLLEQLAELCAKGVVVVGGRVTCGTGDSATWADFRAWNEIVAKARKLGYTITETSITHKNAWATKAGGFWDEREYRLEGGCQ